MKFTDIDFDTRLGGLTAALPDGTKVRIFGTVKNPEVISRDSENFQATPDILAAASELIKEARTLTPTAARMMAVVNDNLVSIPGTGIALLIPGKQKAVYADDGFTVSVTVVNVDEADGSVKSRQAVSQPAGAPDLPADVLEFTRQYLLWQIVSKGEAK